MQMLSLMVIVIGVVYNLFYSIWDKQKYWDSHYSILLAFLSLLSIFCCVLVYNNTSSVVASWKKLSIDEKLTTSEELFSYSFNWTLVAIILFIVLNGVCVAIIKDWIDPLIYQSSDSSNQTTTRSTTRSTTPKNSFKPPTPTPPTQLVQPLTTLPNTSTTPSIPTFIQTQNTPSTPVDIIQAKVFDIMSPNQQNMTDAQKQLRQISLLPSKFSGHMPIQPKNLEMYHKIIQKYRSTINEIKQIFSEHTMITFASFSQTFDKQPKEFDPKAYMQLFVNCEQIFESMEQILVSSPSEQILKINFAHRNSDFGQMLQLIRSYIIYVFRLIFSPQEKKFIYDMNLYLQQTIVYNQNLFLLTELNTREDDTISKEKKQLLKEQEKFEELNRKTVWLEKIKSSVYANDLNKLVREAWNYYQQTCLILQKFVNYHLQNLNYAYEVAEDYVINGKFDKLVKWT
jgi:hypothetical protein